MVSGYLTHMAIGAAGGVLLARLAPGALPGDPALVAVALPLVSAVAATWPDIDHPDAWVSRRARPALALAGAAVALLALGEARTPAELAALLALGGLVGHLLGGALLWGLRRAVGGHRGATHSLLAPGLLLLAWAAQMGTGGWGWLPVLLAWGWLLHILGDAVTPAGWRPLAPLPGPALRLPRRLARHGETAAGAAALTIVAGALGLPGLLAAVAGAGAALALAARRRERGAG